MSAYDFDDAEEISIPVRTQIPIELPPPPDLTNLPSHILHSGTVETLIGQNDDLMARLKVNIRRNSVLEQKLLEQEQIQSELLRQNAGLLSQIQIYEEKDIIVREKNSRHDASQTALREELALLEAKVDSLEARNAELRPSARYVRRARRWIAPLVDRLKMELMREKKALLTKEALISDLRARLHETVQHAQRLERQHMKDQTALVERYEQSLQIAQAEMEKSRHEAKLLRDKAGRVDQAVAESTAHGNRIVYLERQAHDLNEQLTILKRKLKAMELEAASRERESRGAGEAQQSNC